MVAAVNAVETRGISKSFGAVSVLNDIDFDVRRGEVHALAGEYEYAGSWIRSLSDQYHVSDHNEAFFAKHVLGKL